MNTENQNILLGDVIVVVIGALFGLNQFVELTMPIVAFVICVGAIVYAWQATDVVGKFVAGFAGLAILIILLAGSFTTSVVFVENKDLKKENAHLKANPPMVINYSDDSPENKKLLEQKMVPDLEPTAWLLAFILAVIVIVGIVWHFVPEPPWLLVQFKDFIQWMFLIVVAQIAIMDYLHLDGTGTAFYYGFARGGVLAVILFVFSKGGDILKMIVKASRGQYDWVVTLLLASISLVGTLTFVPVADFFFLSKIILSTETSATAAVLAAQAGVVTYAGVLSIGNCILTILLRIVFGKK